MSAARSYRSSSPPKHNRRLGFEKLEDRRVFAIEAELIKDLNGTAASSLIFDFTEVNDNYYFASRATDSVNYQLWKTDGTSSGTDLLLDSPFQINDLTNVNGALYFAADRYNLWKSDGTPSGTTEIARLRDNANSGVSNITNVNGMIYFTGLRASSAHGSPSLYKSDGTTSGTSLIKDSITADFLTNVNGTLYFSQIADLWKSDGTNTGTVLVKGGIGGPYGSISQRMLVGNTLYFIDNNQLWKSDGTTDGTVPVRNISSSATDRPFILANIDSTLIFTNYDREHGYELWKSNGSDAGTVMIKDINPGQKYALIDSATTLNKELSFMADDGVHGRELWKSDGTENGTVMIKDIQPGIGSSSGDFIDLMTVVGDITYFRANDGVNGYTLWRTDGTNEGTIRVLSSTPGQNVNLGSHARELFNANGTLFFEAATASTGTELWRTIITNDPPAAIRIDNTVSTIPENTNLPTDDKVADIRVIDDGMGTDNLALTGPDAAYFTIVGSELRLKAGTKLDYETKSSYHVTVTVDDPTIGKTPDASANFTLTVTNVGEPTLIISLNAAGNVEVKDIAGKNDNLTLWRNGPNVVIRDNSSAFDRGFTITNVPGASGSGTTQVSIPFATIQATGKPLLIATGNGNDTIQLDFLALYGTAPIPSTGLMLSLGNGNDTLAFVNDATSNVWNLTGPQSGSVSVGQVGTVKFNGVEHIGGGQGADVFKLTNAAAANGILSIDSGRASMLNSLEVVRDASYTLSDTQLIITPNVVGPPPQTFSLANFEQVRLTIKHGDTLEKYLWTASTKTLKRLP